MDADSATKVVEVPDFTVVEALAAFRALCLPCLVTQTGARLEKVLLELEALDADVAELRCAVCEDDWPVFATMDTLLSSPRADAS
jgi:hypothetical protein